MFHRALAFSRCARFPVSSPRFRGHGGASTIIDNSPFWATASFPGSYRLMPRDHWNDRKGPECASPRAFESWTEGTDTWVPESLQIISCLRFVWCPRGNKIAVVASLQFLWLRSDSYYSPIISYSDHFSVRCAYLEMITALGNNRPSSITS